MATNMVSDAVLDLKWLAEQGAMFALPAGRTKGKFPEGWQNSPHGFDEAVIHGKRGGNVGILTGKHSANIVALDRDISFPETCQLIGDFSLTAKIIRSNAQERGKFLFRVVGGEIPQTVSWKPEGEKHPHAEFLGDNGQRHALGPTSVYNEGYYSLIDKEYGIKEITPSEIDYLWRLITGGSIYKDVREQEQEEAKTPTGGDNKTANDDYLKSVLAYWTTRKVFEHFNKMTNGTKREGSQLRILGNGGLLLGANNEQWSIPGENIGGGPIQAYTWCKWGKVIKPKGKEFWEIINSMADDAGIAKPTVYLNGRSPKMTGTKDTSQPSDDGSIESLFLSQSADDEGNAQCVKHLHGDKFLFCNAYGWLQNVGTHWEYEGLAEPSINIAITETLIQRRMAAVKADRENIIKATKPTATNKENTKRQIKDRLWADVNSFDDKQYLLNSKSGVIDLRTGRMVSHTPSDRFTYCVNAEYGMDANCTVWLDFISKSVKDFDKINEWVQMACGYSITGYTSEEIMFYLYGPSRSGKGTFTNAFLKMMGQPLAKGVNFSMFTAKREGDNQNFDLAPLKPCRFIAASESGKYQSLNEAAVKQITGNDPISASFKGKDGFTYFPQFKIWLASNHPVKGDVDDDAFWGRVKVIEFPNSHLGEEDKSLKNRMQSPDCCNALLAYLVEGARMWFNEPKGLITPTPVKESTAKQRLELDEIQRWLDEKTERKEGANTTNSDLYASYEAWCEANGVEPKRSNMFGRSLSAKGLEASPVRKPGMNPQRGYKNILLVHS